MNFIVNFERRDFSGPFFPSCELVPECLTWSAFGGCDQAVFSASGQASALLGLSALLRCGVKVFDPLGSPSWWGYVDLVEIRLDKVMITVSLDRLFNKVTVKFSHPSPDNKLAEPAETSPSDNTQSQSEYGIKETTITIDGIDADRADFLRDTFLSQHAWPLSVLSQIPDGKELQARVHCSGWFKTLSWRTYENNNGFFANYGPGPGVHAFGNASTSTYVGQSFTTGDQPCYLKYAYFQLRKEGTPSKNIYARVHLNDPWYPGAVLATSQAVACSVFPSTSYDWIKFTWTTPYLLSANTRYWITIDPNGTDAANYFYIRLDENQTYVPGDGRYWNGSAWYLYPSKTQPGGRPDTVFRVICLNDTSEQLAAIAAAGNQFLQRITAVTTGRQTSPFRAAGRTCQEEIEDLLKLGTSNDRLVLATVTPDRDLHFYEQPDPANPDIFLDRDSHFYTNQGVKLTPFHPPIGRFARLSATNRITLPWDRHRLPACFIAGVEYFPSNDRVVVKSI